MLPFFQMDWLWKSLFGRVVWSVLSIGGAVLLGWMKKRGSIWVQPTLYALGAFLILASLRIVFEADQYLSSRSSALTDSEIEPAVRQWLDNFHLAAKVVSDDGAVFSLNVVMPNGDPMLVSRRKDYSRYIFFYTKLDVSPEHERLSHLSAQQQLSLSSHVLAEMAKQGMSSVFSGAPVSITLYKRIPITPSLTESVFMNALETTDDGLIIARQTFIEALDSIGLFQQFRKAPHGL